MIFFLYNFCFELEQKHGAFHKNTKVIMSNKSTGKSLFQATIRTHFRPLCCNYKTFDPYRFCVMWMVTWSIWPTCTGNVRTVKLGHHHTINSWRLNPSRFILNLETMAEGAKAQKVLIAVDGSDHANYAVKCKYLMLCLESSSKYGVQVNTLVHS